jgi:hypothetical protein
LSHRSFPLLFLRVCSVYWRSVCFRYGSRFWIAALLSAAVAGCGKSDVVTKQVQGTITFEGQAPPTNGKITFAPIEAAPSFPRRSASGEFDASGTFTLTTFKPGDGIIPGRYQTNILCWREKPTLETKLTANYVPPDFQHEVTIDADADEPIDLRIDVPKIQRAK